MKNFLNVILIALIITSCSKNEKRNMMVTGTIDGLKKGTLYLQKLQDSSLISVDSVLMDGTGKFVLSDNVENSELYFISLKNNNSEGERIQFFGEPAEITITSKLSKFATSVTIVGSKNQLIFEEHRAMIQKFNGKQLDLYKEKFDAHKNNNSELALQLAQEEENLIRRRYLYSTNFAVNNATSEVAPYIALFELYNANVKLLDTINNSLSPEVKKSKYGVELNKYIKKIKAIEN